MKERSSAVAFATETAVETLDAPCYRPVLAGTYLHFSLGISVALDAPIRLASPRPLGSGPC